MAKNKKMTIKEAIEQLELEWAKFMGYEIGDSDIARETIANYTLMIGHFISVNTSSLNICENTIQIVKQLVIDEKIKRILLNYLKYQKSLLKESLKPYEQNKNSNIKSRNS
ncbi:MAG: hypothetical protein IJV31_08085 [Clostridia bacterium]|nr:hypothetical protein [Clostridia bacterium]